MQQAILGDKPISAYICLLTAKIGHLGKSLIIFRENLLLMAKYAVIFVA